MAMDANLVKDYKKQTMTKSIVNQGDDADVKSRSFIHMGAHRPGGIVPEMVNKSVEGVGVLRRTERAARMPVEFPQKLDQHDPLVATTNISESRGKHDREKLLVAPMAVNMSVAQFVQG